VNPLDFAFVAALVKRMSGIVIGPDKAYLVETRLAPLVRRRGTRDLATLISELRAGDAALQKLVVEAMTTNETLFFRDRIPFEHFNKIILPHLMGTRPRGSTIRIWCAACSTGQEPYSLSMMLEDLGALGSAWKFDILATDLSEAVIERARAGVYNQFEVQRGLPVRNLIRFFAQQGQEWRIEPKLRSRIEFRTLNLIEDFSRLGRFDVIFCRNVLIYFDDESKRALLERLAASLQPDGFVLLGAAETPYGFTSSLTRYPDEPGLLIRLDGVDNFSIDENARRKKA
jgi:chemotaxis protein methyltransferase CheR